MHAGFEGFAGFVLSPTASEPMKYAVILFHPFCFTRSLNKPRKRRKARNDEAVKMENVRCSSQTRRLHLAFAFQADEC